MKNAFTLLLIIVSIIGHAEESCRRGQGLETDFGKLVSIDCSNEDQGKYTTRHTLLLNETKLVESEYLFGGESNKSRSIWIYKGKWKERPALYLIDISKTPAVVIVFGVNLSTNDFDYASWGNKNSVIAIKDNTKFTYHQDGKMTPPSQYAMEYGSTIFDGSLIEYRTDGTVYKSPDMRKFTPFVVYLSPPGNQ